MRIETKCSRSATFIGGIRPANTICIRKSCSKSGGRCPDRKTMLMQTHISRSRETSPTRAFLPSFAVFAAALFSTAAASGQGTDRYTKAANQLVELFNVGDYAGIQTNFTKEMDAALPLDKSSAFFSGLA